MTDHARRLAAAERRELTYLGRFCKLNEAHGGKRYTSNGCCVACVNTRAAARHQRIRSLLAGTEHVNG